ncbi:PQQ-dependent sugar dehydrogenase [Arcticibacter sp. MXS-1]|uniref:PQQ-dependent sugar dehydrogenase n=1 Tax=Arcticibacter sp. MXS-1 TaxID=3341726 RepID=UPI0035A8649D
MKNIAFMRRRMTFVLSILFAMPAGLAFAQKLTGPYGEEFKSRVVAKGLSDPWELIYGPDNFLWITEAKGYRVSRVNPANGEKKVLLDLSHQRNFPRYDKTPDSLDGGKPWPQGGLMGLALHPQLLNGKPYVYLAYIYNDPARDSTGDGGKPNWGGHFFTGRIVCYQYDPQQQSLSNPVMVCDSIPQSSDHNGGRLLVAPVGGKEYLFYTVGDMGAGQFDNGGRTNHAQNKEKYEGKVLRFNALPDADMNIYDRWIPNDNPFNGARQNAVWSLGHRNPQGLAWARIGGKDLLYSSEHGPFSDDEINLIEKGKNYGHPLVIGYNDNNYNGFAAAVSDRKTLPGDWHTTYPLIASEEQNVKDIGETNFRGPIKSMYVAEGSFLNDIFLTTRDKPDEKKVDWPAVAPSGTTVYTSDVIPGWKNSLLVTSLKEARLVRLKLNERGTGISGDTIGYFKAKARYRDVAFSPDGKRIYLSTDSSSVTSGPSEQDPEGSSLHGAILELTWQKGGTDLDDIEERAGNVADHKSARKLLKDLFKSLREMDGGTARKVMFSPEAKLAFNLLVKRRLTEQDIQLTKKLTSSLVSSIRDQSN